MKVQPSNIVTVSGCSAQLLDLVLATCNYEASGDGCVLVDVGQLENTSDTSGKVGKLLEAVQKAVAEHHQSLGAELTNEGQWHGYNGLILLKE